MAFRLYSLLITVLAEVSSLRGAFVAGFVVPRDATARSVHIYGSHIITVANAADGYGRGLMASCELDCSTGMRLRTYMKRLLGAWI